MIDALLLLGHQHPWQCLLALMIVWATIRTAAGILEGRAQRKFDRELADRWRWK